MDQRKPRVQRRQALKITHKKFQMAFLLFSFAVGAITTTTSVLAMNMMVAGMSNSISGIREMDWDQIEAVLRNETQKATMLIIAVSLVNVLVTAIVGIFFSHRVAGIVLRMTNTLHQWSAGEPVGKIVPREGDFFTELVDEVNEVIKEPRSHVSERHDV